MAIIDDNVTSQDVDKKIKELKTIDINDSSLAEGKEENINPNADAWERACPPPDGVFHLKLHEAKVPYQQGESEDGTQKWYVANLECKIVDGETATVPNGASYNGVTIFAKVSSYIPAGKEISTMAGLIAKMGVKVPKTITHLALLKLLKKCLSQEPKLYCEGEWAAWDMSKGEWIKRQMKSFPRTEDGKGFRHIVRDSKGNEVVAKWKPGRWFGNKEYREILEKEKLRKAQQGNNQQAQQAKAAAASTSEQVGGFEEINTNVVVNSAPVVDDKDFVIEE